MSEVIEKLQSEVHMSEAYLTGLFWKHPEFYLLNQNDKISSKTFLNPIWSFYFGLGRHMADKGITVFDDITTSKAVGECKVDEKFGYFGGYSTIKELIDEPEIHKDNFDGYYQEVKKYTLIKDLTGLFGEQVVKPNGKYNYKKMNAAQIQLYWTDKVNQVALSFDSPFEEAFLLEGLRESLKEWDEEPDIGMPFYQSRMMSKICGGFSAGNLFLHGGFGGKGKTSLTFNKVVMSCIEHKEKLVVIANEQSIEEFKKMLFVTAMGVGTKDAINRQRLNEGSFTEDENTKLQKALDWVKTLCEDEKLIAFVFMEHYTMANVRKVLTHYANRGYKRVIIDTGKPGDDRSSKQRWEQFTEDMVDLYKMTRPNGGGLNLSVWVNVQLADSALGQRYLDEYALGVAKAAKNESSVFFLSRPVWEDEYKDGKYELTVNKRVYNEITEEWQTEEFKLDPVYTDAKGNKYANHYYLLFTAKNRRGQSNDTGQDVLVLNWVPNSNIWFEAGMCRPTRTRNYAQ